MRWRLGLDLGTNSLGWAAAELDDDDNPVRLFAAGTRLFSSGRDPKTGASLAVDRRAARAMRRRRDRFKQRQAALLKHLTLAGLFPDQESERLALAALDPYALRARALHEPLSLHQIGRALFHLNQRRGFKSNRKTLRRQNDEDGKIKIGVNRLYNRIRDDGAITLGEFLHNRRAASTDDSAIPNVRVRLRPETGEDAKSDGYDFYPDRQMLEDEFEEILNRQQPHHPKALTEVVHDRLYEVIFCQRKLRAPKIGLCTLDPSEERLPKAHPLFQTRRLLEELNALKILRPGIPPKSISKEQRDLLYLKIKDKRSATFDSLRKALKLEADARFNKEANDRRDLKGDEVAAELGSKNRFGKRWASIFPDVQWEIVRRILAQESEADEDALKIWLQETHRLTAEQAESTIGARLPVGYGRFGLTATMKLITALKAAVIVYSDAVKSAGYGHHSDFRTGEVLAELPYYGAVLQQAIMPGTGRPEDDDDVRIGRLSNPTVHIGLNQLRLVVNALIKRFGPPYQIAIELARDLKMTEEDKQKLNTRNRQNRDAAKRRGKSLVEIFNQPDKGSNRTLLKLWEELNPENSLDRRCIYSGKMISATMLFSGAVEVDHILPFSKTLDNAPGNLLLCLRDSNRGKRNRSPYDAFGTTAGWDDILDRAQSLPPEKRWRFQPDAMARFNSNGDFLDRQLVDTQYLSKLARSYLSSLYQDKGEGSSHVWASPGRMTEMLRRSWGLNSLLPDHNITGNANQQKNRSDHRHHAIDAAVVVVTDRGMLQRIATEAGAKGQEAANRLTSDLPEPWPEFTDELRSIVTRIVVSHRPDHGSAVKSQSAKGKDATAGRLHNDTAYGLTGQKDKKGSDLVVRRVPFGMLRASDLPRVRDEDLRNALSLWLEGYSEDKAFKIRLLDFPVSGPEHYRAIRRLRMIEPLSVIPIRDKSGRAYKGYKGDSNFRFDVWEMKDGKWVPEVVTMFDANQPGWASALRAGNPTARKVLSLQQEDILAIEQEVGTVRLMRVVKFGQNGQITLIEHQEGGDLKRRDADAADPFKYFSPTASGLKRIKARQVRVDALGRVFDPGPRDRSV